MLLKTIVTWQLKKNKNEIAQCDIINKVLSESNTES